MTLAKMNKFVRKTSAEGRPRCLHPSSSVPPYQKINLLIYSRLLLAKEIIISMMKITTRDKVYVRWLQRNTATLKY